MINIFTNTIAEAFFPNTCIICSNNINKLDHIICQSCFSMCIKNPNPNYINKKTGAVFYYELAIRKLILRAKFGGCEISANILIKLISNSKEYDYLINIFISKKINIISYVPSHWTTNFTRKINLPKLFALKLSKDLNLPILKLINKKNYRSLSSLKKRHYRREQVKNSFELISNKKFENLILIDDIVTTQSTFDESRKILKKVSKNIWCLAIAQTPK